MKKALLEKILAYGIRKEYFEFCRLGDLNSTPAPEIFSPVIDFDLTKTRVCGNLHLQMVTSCDALRIIPELGRIDFIELKSIHNFLTHSENQDLNTLRKKVRSFNLEDKIQDSHFLLQAIAFNKKVGLTREERRDFHLVEKNYFIVIDTDLSEHPDYTLALTMDFLSQARSYAIKHQQILETIQAEVEDLQTIEVNAPRIMGIRAMHKLYQELNLD